MPHQIHPLPPTLISRIAAGEIILSPASLIKELLENAIDAHATQITVTTTTDPCKRITISDDGGGIHTEDLAMLCTRFATSKISKFEDLAAIGTFGFRGEALSSISHIAHVEVITKREEEECAYRAKYHDSKLVGEPKICAGNQGTSLTIEDLFYNVPMRRKSLKSNGEEYSKILDIISKYALANPHIGFICKKQGSNTVDIQTNSGSSIIDNIRLLHSSTIAKEIISFSEEDADLDIRVKCNLTNANFNCKKMRFFCFINGRSVDCAILKKVFQNLYLPLLPKGTFPFVFIDMKVNPARLDVNIHPTKKEVKFAREDDVAAKIMQWGETCLQEANRSRTFLTQTVLAPIVPRENIDPPSKNVYDKNMVRTDHKARSLRSFWENTQPENSQSMITEREECVIDLDSIRALREEVIANSDDGLTKLLHSHKFCGLVNHDLALIQSDVKLYLVNYRELSQHMFYQLALAKFGNMGLIELSDPPKISDLLVQALEDPNNAWKTSDPPKNHIISQIEPLLLSKSAMLEEYFNVRITEDSTLRAIPLLLPGYVPNLNLLADFILRLGTEVDWTTEKPCFDTVLKEISIFYACESPLDDWDAYFAQSPKLEHPELATFKRSVELNVFDTLKNGFLAPRSMPKETFQCVANIPDLYKVFERC